MVYHGSNRNDNFNQDQLERADVVLTSYSVMEVDYRRNVMAPKATCKFCSKKFQPERLKVHLRCAAFLFEVVKRTQEFLSCRSLRKMF